MLSRDSLVTITTMDLQSQLYVVLLQDLAHPLQPFSDQAEVISKPGQGEAMIINTTLHSPP